MRPAFWFLSLAALSVGARNFEEGISVDGPLYAQISRNISRSGEWFRLDGGIPDFQPFAEHPHLGFWIGALVFKVLPSGDWSARIPGHLFYLFALALAYLVTKRLFTERAAVFAILLLWSFGVFSNYFSTFYLDPGCLVFGTLFLVFYAKGLGIYETRLPFGRGSAVVASLVAGVFLALAFLQKGLTALGFGPVGATLFGLALYERRPSLRVLLVSLCPLIASSLILGFYAVALSRSAVPDFLDLYWSRQMTHRFATAYDGKLLFSGEFWRRFARDTYGLLWLLPLALYVLRAQARRVVPPLSFLLSFLLMYAPAGRIGSQYAIMLLPPLAILLAAAIDKLLQGLRPPFLGDPDLIRKATGRTALTLVLLAQYLPISTHYPRKPFEADALVALEKSRLFRKLVLVSSRPQRDFTLSASFAWYVDTRIEYRQALPRTNAEIDAESVYLVPFESAETVKIPAQLCRLPDHGPSRLYRRCVRGT